MLPRALPETGIAGLLQERQLHGIAGKTDFAEGETWHGIGAVLQGPGFRDQGFGFRA